MQVAGYMFQVAGCRKSITIINCSLLLEKDFTLARVIKPAAILKPGNFSPSLNAGGVRFFRLTQRHRDTELNLLIPSPSRDVAKKQKEITAESRSR
ncbi:MAG: hypothetical protein J0M37_13640 [Ignavibacteria bacterium]|nr:hypothetical protein [Ignavibacteria bacterium]